MYNPTRPVELQSAIGRQFGSNLLHYAKGRRGYPEAIFALLSRYVGFEEAVLDVGCGSGIATRELFEYGFQNVTGSDPDAEMIREAKYSSHPSIAYVEAEAEKLPFPDKHFSCLTAFASFHWFCNNEAIHEIKRVLLSEGYFLVVNRQDLSSFRRDFESFLEHALGKSIYHTKEGYEPERLLLEAGFEISEELSIEHVDSYTLEEALHYCQSLSIWHALSTPEKEKLLPQVAGFLECWIEQGQFLREVKINCNLVRKLNN